MTLYTQDGGHEYRDGVLWPLEPTCSTCRSRCNSPDACQLPESEPPAPRRFSINPEVIGAVAGAALGLAGALALAYHLIF